MRGKEDCERNLNLEREQCPIHNGTLEPFKWRKMLKIFSVFYSVFKCLNLIVPVGFHGVSSEIIVYSPFKINLNVLLTNQNQTKAV